MARKRRFSNQSEMSSSSILKDQAIKSTSLENKLKRLREITPTQGPKNEGFKLILEILDELNQKVL